MGCLRREIKMHESFNLRNICLRDTKDAWVVTFIESDDECDKYGNE